MGSSDSSSPPALFVIPSNMRTLAELRSESELNASLSFLHVEAENLRDARGTNGGAVVEVSLDALNSFVKWCQHLAPSSASSWRVSGNCRRWSKARSPATIVCDVDRGIETSLDAQERLPAYPTSTAIELDIPCMKSECFKT